MPLTLEQFAERVENFRALSDPEKIKYFVWFAHRADGKDRVNTGDIRSFYDALHLVKPNISENLTRLSARKPPVLLKDGSGFYLEGRIRSFLDAAHLSAVQETSIEVGDHVLPDAMVKGTKPYIEKIAFEINGSFQCQFYDGSAVLMRRLIESLLIEAFGKAGHTDKIRQNNEFMMLERIIAVAKGGQYVMLARGSDKILEDVKYLGDRSAHSRSYIASKKDITDLILRFRTIIAELLHLADIHPTI